MHMWKCLLRRLKSWSMIDKYLQGAALSRWTHSLMLMESLRCSTRLQDAENTDKPILFPMNHALTKKIIDHEHDKTKHAYGTDYTLSEIRRKYWIPSGRQQVKKVLKNCRQCKLNFGTPKAPQMAPLPAIRTEGSMLPFSNASVDFSGAYLTVQGRGKVRQKRYLCLFVCNETRAVH